MPVFLLSSSLNIANTLGFSLPSNEFWLSDFGQNRHQVSDKQPGVFLLLPMIETAVQPDLTSTTTEVVKNFWATTYLQFVQADSTSPGTFAPENKKLPTTGGKILELKKQNTNLRKTINRIDAGRRNDYYTVLEDVAKLVMLTDNPLKAAEIYQMFLALSGGASADFRPLSPQRPEIMSDKVIKVAGTKAALGFHDSELTTDIAGQKELVHKLRNWSYLVHLANNGGAEILRKIIPTGVLFIGADINYHVFNPATETWQQNFNLERLNRELTQAEIATLFLEMQAQYCFPVGGKIRALWDNGVVMLNGGVHAYHDVIEVVSGPLDPALFQSAFSEAIASGNLYRMNPRIKMFETLILNGKIESIATLSEEEKAKGITLTQKRRAPSPLALQQLFRTVGGNIPPRMSV
jgi:hypothetical protein